MAIQRMDHVGVVVEDLAAAVAFFVELGLEVEGEGPEAVEGQWVDKVVGIEGVRVDIVFVRTPDGHSRLELTKFHAPTAVSAESIAPNTLGLRRLMFAVDDIDEVVARMQVFGAEPIGEWRSTRTSTGSAMSMAPAASSSLWLKSWAEADGNTLAS